ncbi:MAG TPA: type III-A CRISPR-associated RAMP protein Csm5 [Candidatus Aminicenantes bacterium]|nr:MAG: type III-A CRISPR-associated RAMP protein Csm5 [Candidatus Aminicenantes bacterium]HEK86295.1 type III-A CRISPR-associated RAMP protein Csm5 [Candidatus Aminicenantes bacterium]
MKIKVKTITPVHIGSGEEISPIEYFIDKEKGYFNVLNMDRLFSDKAFEKYREKFIKEASITRYIGKIIPDQDLLRKHLKYSIPISLEARQSNPIEVKSFIKSAGRPFIPGSSIKGAMISALVYYALRESYKNSADKSHLLSMFNSRKDGYDDLLAQAYGFLAKEKRSASFGGKEDKFLNLFDVSDSSCLESKRSLRVELAKVDGAKRGGNIPIMYETLKESVEAEFEIRCKNCRLDEKKVLEICHEFYQKVARKDGVNIPVSPYLLRIGQGVSAYGTSLLILAEEMGTKDYFIKPPRTRKRLLEGIEKKAMGFVQLIPV